MIYSLTADVIHIGADHVVLDVNGVGYFVYTNSASLINMHFGQKVTIYTCLVVREDSMTLYGFLSLCDREVFNVLLNVSGVGPKLALACLNVHDASSMTEAVINGDLKALEKIPGVGKKSAQRMILEIGNKLGEVKTVENNCMNANANPFYLQVVDALVQLGWNKDACESAVQALLKNKDYDNISLLLKESLIYLGENHGR